MIDGLKGAVVSELLDIDTGEDWHRWTLGPRSPSSWFLGLLLAEAVPGNHEVFNRSEKPGNGFRESTS